MQQLTRTVSHPQSTKRSGNLEWSPPVQVSAVQSDEAKHQDREQKYTYCKKVEPSKGSENIGLDCAK
jgi:hypothetical protein